MSHQNLFGQVESVEEQVGALGTVIGQMKQTIKTLIEENNRLTYENNHLRNRLQKKEQQEGQKTMGEMEQGKMRHPVGEGHDALARLYYEGFHICSQEYGGFRTEGDCLFCLSFLHK